MWRRRRPQQVLDRELRYHVERRIDDLKRSGLTDSEALRAAALEFGGVGQVKEVGSIPAINSLKLLMLTF